MKVEVIRVNGTREEHEISKHNAIGTIHRLIGCETGDSVNLRDGRVMCVDDDGWETEMVDHGNGRFEIKPIRPKKPINAEATKIYQSLYQTTHQIAGDVCIAIDEDFA
jgi:hypothetical protein